MKRAKYVLLLITVFVFIAIGIKTIIPTINKAIGKDQIIGDTIRLNSIDNKNAMNDTIAKDSTQIKIVKQVEINENANELNLRFFDEVTGYAVVPEYVEIKQREDGKSNRSISNTQISKNGSVLIRVANGGYDITIYAEGYKPMQTFYNLNDLKVNINFSLVPVNRPKELSVPFIQSLHQDDVMVIVGTIVDDTTGRPLKNVELYTEDNIAKTNSNESGYFQLLIPLAEEENQVESRGTIYFKLNGYVTEEREHFDLYPNGDLIFKIRMKKGSGINKVKLFKHREVNREIINKLKKGN
ncbi:MAG: hypothetical protein WC780_16355 [Lentimicrobiaceae bacterium]|jgi:hypothetical protein